MTDQTPQSNIRASYAKGRFWVDNKFIDGGYAEYFDREAMIYISFVRRVGNKTQICYPSIETIMRDTGIGNRNIIFKTIEILKNLNMIKVGHLEGIKSNAYRLIDSIYWKPITSITPDTVGVVSERVRKKYQKGTSTSINNDTLRELKKKTKERNAFSHKEFKEKAQEIGDKMRIKPY